MNILNFNNLIQELSIKYSLQDLEVKNIFISCIEEILKTQLIMQKDNDQIYLLMPQRDLKVKRVNLTSNLLKKVSLLFEKKLNTYSKHNFISMSKSFLLKKKIINFEILKKEDDYFIVKSIVGICKLPLSNIPNIELINYTTGSKHFGCIYSYSYKNKEVIINCKSMEVELQKVKSILINSNVIKVNRYYGVRIKIYIEKIPEKTIISNLKMLYSKERVIFVKVRNEQH